MVYRTPKSPPRAPVLVQHVQTPLKSILKSPEASRGQTSRTSPSLLTMIQSAVNKDQQVITDNMVKQERVTLRKKIVRRRRKSPSRGEDGPQDVVDEVIGNVNDICVVF